MVKLESVHTNDSLAAAPGGVNFKPLALPAPVHTLAVSAENQKDEDKLNTLLHKRAEQDLTFTVSFHEETKETVVSGMGEMHIGSIFEKVSHEAKITVLTRKPRVPYRETITKGADAEYTHKKQSGGHGQYGRVLLKAKPLERGEDFELTNDIRGGSISKGYFPGIEKGLREAMAEGFLAGYPMVDIGVSVYDGKEHPVDSSELSFKLAAKNALKTAFENAGAVLLEPMVNLTVFVDDHCLGDILSDLSTKRAPRAGPVPHRRRHTVGQSPGAPGRTAYLRHRHEGPDLGHRRLRNGVQPLRTGFRENGQGYNPLRAPKITPVPDCRD